MYYKRMIKYLMCINKKNAIKYTLIATSIIFITSCSKKNDGPDKINNQDKKPKIINIVNFIRDIEPRDPKITKEVLYETVVEQVKMMKKYNLKGTFLLQYDALVDKRYQELLKNLPKDQFEIGAWWEIPQPMVKKAGLIWRGRFPWDWHADVGFSTGYNPEEREQLADVYMEDFKRVFGYYPKSVASWFIDAHTLNYLYEKYDIVVSANCKDQYGTDGYTLWGGYWNQAYYPSKVNSYMPAQNEESQIPVPIFRMLGSDPVRQYDTGLESDRQGVITLEPVYKEAGGNKEWVDWYFKEFINGESMEYAYTQAGQENSFTWSAMKKGFHIQLPLIAKLRDENKVKVETLKESGFWFKKKYQTTPATSVTVTTDMKGSDMKTVWYNSRFYRANLLWENNSLRFRDIHVFDEDIESSYLTKPVASNQALFFTQPIIDGFLWSKANDLAGLRFKIMEQGKESLIIGKTPKVTSPEHGVLRVSWPIKNHEAKLILVFEEQGIQLKMETGENLIWYLDFTAPKEVDLPYTSITNNQINCNFQGHAYTFKASTGNFSVPDSCTVYRITPKENIINVSFSSN
ncbi:hypothetical protein [Galbibacter pacificus]|uniref:Uncharacterized protein n=1 Tax=Galbibacter pacificus TaxID=2996052 RepID=A0ABT6FN40_9FLAO|nr:hypothetical protein [Galbibacter pacificus]MDG3581207.1 hypothetical protein [Galbibacter pacificus]MDG3584685.1 hypothetical protein [Galbibacter pacificus]